MLYNPPPGGAPNDPYVGKNVAAGTQGSKVPPAAVEYPQREIVNAILAAGLSPTNSDLTQLLKAIRALATTQGSAMLDNRNITGSNAAVWSLAGTYTWVVPDGVTRLKTRVWGGGGGGGGANGTSAGGSGGGGGGYSEGVFPVTPGQTITLVVGAGGVPGVANPSSTSQRGGTGGTSSVGAFNSALGGTGGWPGIGNLTSTSGSGGTGSGGSINEVGGDGGLSVAFGGGSQVLVGQGGATPHGNGFNSLGVSGGGGVSPFYGTGGNSAGGANAPGGTAAPGRIELYW